jgi:hypothetical protein
MSLYGPDQGKSPLPQGPQLGSGLIRLFSGETKGFAGLLSLAPEVLLLVTFIVFFEWLKKMSALPQEYYATSFVGFASARFMLGNPLLLLGTGFLIVFAFFKWKDFGQNWSDFEYGSALRLIAMASALALAWPLLTSNYNFYFDQAYWIDRLLILVCGCTLLFRPFAILPFMLLAAPLTWLPEVGIGVYSWEFFGMPLRVLALLFSWLVLASAIGVKRTAPFFFVLLCIIAGHYWIPGQIKLRSGWLFANDIFYLLPATYAGGWLGFLQPETITHFANFLATFNFPMKLGTIILECGCVFILKGRMKSISSFLLAFVIFHVGIVLVCGICMWQWALVDLAVVLALWRCGASKNLLQFGRVHLVASILIIVLTPYWLRSAPLAWYDSPVNYICRFEAVDEEGKRSNLSPEFFAPFNLQFTFCGFSYLVKDQSLLRITYGATNRNIATGLKKSTSIEEIFAFESEHSDTSYDDKRFAHMENFLLRFISNYNRAPNRNRSLPWISPPSPLITFPRRNEFNGDKPIQRIEVFHITSYFDGIEYHEIRKLPIMNIAIPYPEVSARESH